MRQIAVIIGIGVVVIGIGAVAEALELLSHRQRHGVLRAVTERPCSRLRDRAGQGGILAVRGRNIPVRRVEVREIEALRLQLIERRRQLRVDGEVRKALRRNEDEVAALEHAGLFVFVRRRARGEVGVQLRKHVVSLRGYGVKIQLQHVRAGVDHRLREDGRLRGVRERRLRRGLRRGFHRCFRLRRQLDLAALKAEQQPVHVQPERGHQAEVGRRLLHVVRVVIEVIGRKRLRAEDRQQGHQAEMHGDGQRRKRREIRKAQPRRRKALSEHGVAHGRQEHQA